MLWLWILRLLLLLLLTPIILLAPIVLSAPVLELSCVFHYCYHHYCHHYYYYYYVYDTHVLQALSPSRGGTRSSATRGARSARLIYSIYYDILDYTIMCVSLSLSLSLSLRIHIYIYIYTHIHTHEQLLSMSVHWSGTFGGHAGAPPLPPSECFCRSLSVLAMWVFLHRTAIQPLTWCSESLSSRGAPFSRGVLSRLTL